MRARLERWLLAKRRQRWQRKANVKNSPLFDLWERSPPVGTVERWLSIDLESTGLDPRTDHIVSIGWVEIANQRIELDSARHILVQSKRAMNQSATIHGIVDADLAEADSLEHALTELFLAAAGRTLVCHGAQLDLGLLNRACRQLFNAPLLMPHEDTLVRAKKRLDRSGQGMRSGALRLQALRKAHGLPPTASHNALTDALATAELFLAQNVHSGSARYE